MLMDICMGKLSMRWMAGCAGWRLLKFIEALKTIASGVNLHIQRINNVPPYVARNPLCREK